MLAIIPTAVSAAASTNEIEYAKQTWVDSDGKKTSTQENGYNPKTNDFRADFVGQDKNTSNYVLKKGTKTVTINRNSKGKAISGTYMMKNAKAAKEWIQSIEVASFSSLKAEYQKANWKKVGSVKDENGKTSTKLSGTSKPGKNNDWIQYAYIDKDTGLPVKIESYVIKNKKKELQGTYLYEYKHVSGKTGIFDVSGVNLKKVK
ncbi:MAG: hypothetical protein WCD89_10985 [Anaerocolumna sp.]